MIDGLAGWLWALPLFMLWFVPAQWIRTKERQYARAAEKAGGDPAQLEFWLRFDDLGRGFWLGVVLMWAVVGGIATWLAAYFVRDSHPLVAVLLALFLIGTAWSTGWRNLLALMWIKRGGPVSQQRNS